MDNVFLGIGSNVGDRYQNILDAIEFLGRHPDVEIRGQSAIYETEPYGYLEQDNFLNMVIKISTTLKPENLLKYINEIEQQLGRKREIHWGPRTIDIDILLYGKEIIKTDKLIIPHLEMTKRLFVLVPLSEIYSSPIPGEKKSLEDLIEGLDKNEGAIKLWKA